MTCVKIVRVLGLFCIAAGLAACPDPIVNWAKSNDFTPHRTVSSWDFAGAEIQPDGRPGFNTRVTLMLRPELMPDAVVRSSQGFAFDGETTTSKLTADILSFGGGAGFNFTRNTRLTLVKPSISGVDDQQFIPRSFCLPNSNEFIVVHQTLRTGKMCDARLTDLRASLSGQIETKGIGEIVALFARQGMAVPPRPGTDVSDFNANTLSCPEPSEPGAVDPKASAAKLAPAASGLREFSLAFKSGILQQSAVFGDNMTVGYTTRRVRCAGTSRLDFVYADQNQPDLIQDGNNGITIRLLGTTTMDNEPWAWLSVGTSNPAAELLLQDKEREREAIRSAEQQENSAAVRAEELLKQRLAYERLGQLTATRDTGIRSDLTDIERDRNRALVEKQKITDMEQRMRDAPSCNDYVHRDLAAQRFQCKLRIGDEFGVYQPVGGARSGILIQSSSRIVNGNQAVEFSGQRIKYTILPQ